MQLPNLRHISDVAFSEEEVSFTLQSTSNTDSTSTISTHKNTYKNVQNIN